MAKCRQRYSTLCYCFRAASRSPLSDGASHRRAGREKAKNCHMSKQSHRFLEIALLIGLIVGAGTTYALTPLIDNMVNTPSTPSSTTTTTTTVFSTITSTQDSTVTVPQTMV